MYKLPAEDFKFIINHFMDLSNLKQSIIKTLAYGDVFGWPMSEDEIFIKVQSSKLKVKSYSSKFKVQLKQLIKKKKIGCKNGFCFLPGKGFIVKRRLEREKWAKEKMKIAKNCAKYLKIIPSILLVGVSGGLAVDNVSKDDDIDFFIICRNGTLWTTRFLSTFLLDFLGKRRRPGDKDVRDKICLNMFVDELGMQIPEKERDLYMAHEVVQMNPVWDKNNAYRKFLKANMWVANIFRKTRKASPASPDQISRKVGKVEYFFREFQLKYMSGRRTTEKIEPHRLMFHPEDKRDWVMREFRRRLK